MLNIIHQGIANWNHTKIYKIPSRRAAKILKADNAKYWRELKQLEFSYTVGRSIMVWSLQKSLAVSYELSHGLWYELIILILEKWEYMAYAMTYTWMLIWPFHESQKMKTTQMPLIKWMDILWYFQKWNSTQRERKKKKKRNELLTYLTTWVNPRNMMLSKRS